MQPDAYVIASFLVCLFFPFSKEQRVLHCIECSSDNGGVSNPKCSYNGPVSYEEDLIKVCNGFCYARTVAEQSLIVRGCTSQVQKLPSVLPPADCYNWDGATFCICSTQLCNLDEIGPSSGKSLDYIEQQITGESPNPTAAASTVPGEVRTSLNTTTGATTAAEQQITGESPNPTAAASTVPGEVRTSLNTTTGATTAAVNPAATIKTPPTTQAVITAAPTKPVIGDNFTIQCFECRSFYNNTYYSFCPTNGSVIADMVYLGDCKGPCFTRRVAGDDRLVVRGCTATQGTLPNPLPPEGCYDWEGAAYCVCHTSACNKDPMGNSSGASLGDYIDTDNPAVITTAPTKVTAPIIGDNFTIKCFECRSFSNNKSYSFCPIHGSVIADMAYLGDCKGPCFTRLVDGDERLVVRGCTATQGNLPNPLPAEGCYDWEGAAYYVCYTSACNKAPMCKSSGVSLDDHIITGNPGPSGGPLQCFQCTNYNQDGKYVAQCPKDARVNLQTVYSANCSGVCFTRTFSDNSTKVARGCTADEYGFPEPLPPSGCYNYKNENWCICNTSQCNGGPIGKSNGKDLDAHLYETGDDFVEKDGVNKCYQCLNYFQNVYYPQCPKNARVRNAYLAPCNGSCFTRTYDKDDKIVARGCTDYLHDLPKPLPPDGCYTWYTEIWCVCSKSRCNGAALATPQNIEFDAHIQHVNGRGAHQTSGVNLCVIHIFTVILFLRWYLVI